MNNQTPEEIEKAKLALREKYSAELRQIHENHAANIARSHQRERWMKITIIVVALVSIVGPFAWAYFQLSK